MKVNDLNQMTAEEIAEACEVTASLLEGHWTQGKWWDAYSGTYCLEGALAAALDFETADLENNPDRQLLIDCQVYEAIRDTLNMQHDEDPEDCMYVDSGELPSWNDNANRTEQEVLDLLHATAKRVMGVEP